MPQIDVNNSTLRFDGLDVAIDDERRVSSRPRIGEVLLSPIADSRFLVINPGTAMSLPTMSGMPLVRGRRRASGPAMRTELDWQLKAGRRYIDPVTGLRLLCIWPGPGLLHCEGRALIMERDSRDRLVPAPIREGGRCARATECCSSRGVAIGC